MSTSTETLQADEAIATQPGGALAHNGLVPTIGLEDYDGTEFRLPRISIAQTAQQMTEWGAQAGQFHNSVTGDNLASLDGVVLTVKQNRWYGPDFEESTKLRSAGKEVTAYCRSSNGKTPDADVAQRQADLCKICPRSKGIKNPDGSFDPPACSEIRKVLIALADGTVGMLTARKKAVREVDNFIQPFFLRKASPMSVRATVTSRAEKGNGNTWYVSVFKARMAEPVSPEEQASLGELASLYLPMVQRVEESDTHGEENLSAYGNAGATNAAASPEPVPPEPVIDVKAVLADSNMGF